MVTMLKRLTLAGTPDPCEEKVSLRELEIVKLIACGYSNEQIAARLKGNLRYKGKPVSRRTVQAHVHLLFKRCQVKDRTSLVIRFIQERLLDPGDIELMPP